MHSHWQGNEQRNRTRVCLNPCFNGRCTRTMVLLSGAKIDVVLILVLMEDALAQEIIEEVKEEKAES